MKIGYILNFDLLVALKKDVEENTEHIQSEYGYDMSEGQARYLKDFLARHPEFDDSQKTFDVHIGYVGLLFNEHIY